MINFIFKLTKSFRASGRDTVPRILKDPKFGRQGVIRRKRKPLDYDLTQPHIKNPELYFDSKSDPKLYKIERNERKRRIEQYDSVENLQEKREMGTMIQELTDKQLLRKPSRRIINNILNIEKFHPQQLAENMQLIKSSIFEVSKEVQQFKFRDFAILVILAERYHPDNVELWGRLVLNLSRSIEQREYYDNSFVKEQVRSQATFIYILNIVYKASARLPIDISLLRKSVANNLLQNCSIDDINEFSLFVTTVCKLLENGKQRTLFEKKMIPLLVQKVEQMDVGYVVSLIHMMYKNKVVYLDRDLDKIIKRFIEKKEEINQDLFSVFVISLANLRKENVDVNTKQFVQQYFEQNQQIIVKINNVAFLLEGLKKMRILKREYFSFFEPIILENMQKLKPQQSIQLLRGCGKDLRYSDNIIQQIINTYDLNVGEIRQEEKEMVGSVLKKFQSFVDLTKLKNYDQVFTKI